LFPKLVSLAPVVALFAIACGNTYHPEYHPVTTTSFTESYSNPVVVHNGGAPSERSPVFVEPAPGPINRPPVSSSRG
jgi:hypothetical protein